MIKKLWLKFESMINKTIAIILDILAKIYKKNVPEKCQQNLHGSIKNIGRSYLAISKHFKFKVTLPKTIPKITFQNLLVPLKNIRSALSRFVTFTKNIDFSVFDFRHFVLEKLKGLRQLIQPVLISVKSFFSSLTPNTILILVISFAFLTLVFLGIIKSGRTIYLGVLDNQGNLDRSDDRAVPKYRESYFKRILPAKQLNVYEVTMPIYIDSINSVRTLLIDLTLTTSNRYAREYLDKHSFLIKDRLNNTIHPIIPDFPLTKEGKTIIKEKVIYEINQLLNEKKIEGEIKEVNFQMIIAA